MKRAEIKRRPLADTTLINLEPEAIEYRELDAQGLYFRVKPDGQKSWQLRYKKPDGKWSWLGLGGYPSVGSALARIKAQEARTLIAQGIDPSAQRKAIEAEEKVKAENTFEILAGEWYATRKAGWGDGYAKRVMGALELHVFPRLGKRAYTDITPMEWMDLLRGMEKQCILDQMANVRRYCKEIYDLARVTGRAINNPVDGLDKFLQKKQSTNYAHVEQVQLPALLRAISGYSNHAVKIGLRLLVLNGLRPSEVREARWVEIDIDNALWEIPAERMKKRREHIIPLSAQSISLLKELKVLSGAYELLFPGRNDRTKPLSNMVFNMALRRMGYKGQQTGHGFRHIASTILREKGFAKDYVEAQLSHAEDGVAGVYNKAIYLEQRHEMMQWYADHLEALEQGNVVKGRFGKLA